MLFRSYQKTGRVTSVENDDDDYTFYFNTKNGKNGLGYNGLKDDYLYFNGKRLDADDDYRLYYYDGDIYLTNTKGKVQKTSKKYDIENKGIAEDDVKVEISGAGANAKTLVRFDVTNGAFEELGKIADGTNGLQTTGMFAIPMGNASIAADKLNNVSIAD